MKPFVLITILLAAFVVACQPQESTGAYSPNSATYVFAPAVAGDVPLANPSVPSNVTVVVRNDTVNVTLTIYGHNASGVIVEKITQVSNVTKYSVNNSFTGIDCLILNQSVGGGVVVGSFGGNTIATFTSTANTSFNQLQYNGTNYVCPVQRNSTVIDVSAFSEYSLFVSCPKVNNTNVSVSYFVSPDNSLWFPGNTTVPSCNATSISTVLPDKATRFIKLNVNNTDVNTSLVYVKMAYK